MNYRAFLEYVSFIQYYGSSSALLINTLTVIYFLEKGSGRGLMVKDSGFQVREFDIHTTLSMAQF